MRFRTKLFASVFACLLLFQALHAVHAKRASSESVGIRLAFDPPTLDWNLGDVPIHVINNTIEGLYAIDATGNVVADEAVSQPERKSKNVWRIRLRDDLKWSDGKPVVAADYVFSWKRLLSPATASTYAALLSPLKEARAVNEREIEVELKDGQDSFPTSAFTHWSTFPVRADVVAKDKLRWAEPPIAVYNGPYVIRDFQHDVKLTLVPNPQHRSPGKLPMITAWIVPDDSTARNLYESGKIHFMADLGALDRKALAARPDYHQIASPILVYVGFDMRDEAKPHPEFSSPDLRRAWRDSLDRKSIPSVLGLRHIPTLSIVPQDSPEELPEPKARAISKNSKQKPLTLGYFERGSNRTLVELLQAQWKKAGFSVSLESLEVKSYWQRLAVDPFPLFLNSYGPPVWDKRFYFELFTSDNPMNMGRWKNKQYDAFVQNHDYTAAEKLLREEAPVIPLYFRCVDYLLSPRLEGIVLNPMTSLFLSGARLKPQP